MSRKTEKTGQPLLSFFFDLSNLQQLAKEQFDNYLAVLQVLCFERLAENFTGHSDQLNRLMEKISV